MWDFKRLAAATLVVTAGCSAPVPTSEVTIVDDSTIEFPAHVATAGFGDEPMAGYHLIVWDHGGAADHSLFVAEVSDVQVIDGLEALDAQPGDALGINSWDERNDTEATAPDEVVLGPPVTIEFILADGTTLALADVVGDSGGRGFDMRFGGHRANIPEWHSGCVVCLYSCPGSKVGNASYTIRDFVAGATHFTVNRDLLPRDGTRLTVRFRLEASNTP
jgi:hypothetical protein